MSDRAERIRAMLHGVAVGDALGWPFEMPHRVVGEPGLEGAFHRWRRRAGSRFWSYEETLPPGSYSDDTQLTLACGRALLQPDWYVHFVSKELPAWRLYERGGGRTVLRAADAWTRGTAPWWSRPKDQEQYFQSGANGAAMRVAPHVAVGGDVLPRVVVDATATHGHPRALLGAALHAWALEAALDRQLGLNASEAIVAALDEEREWSDSSLLDRLPSSWRTAAGSTYEASWQQHRTGAVEALRVAHHWAEQGALAAEGEVLAALGATDKATNGAGDVSAVAALYLATRYASQPEQALRAAARQPGADTDTLASMVGSLLGALVGQDALASFPGVQDAETINALATDLAHAEAREASVPDELDPRPAQAVDQFTGQLTDGSTDVRLPDGRDAAVVQKRELSRQSTPNEVMGHYLRCSDGQGLLVVTRRKRTKEELPRSTESSTKDEGGQPPQTTSQRQSDSGAAAPPKARLDVHLTLRHSDPRRLAHLLQCAGLTTETDGDTWQVHGAALTILPDDATPRLEFEPRAPSTEITLRTPQIDLACERLRDAGWQVDSQGDEVLIVEGGVAVRLVPAPS
jgi:ADP-ribosylglycohydrolase